MDNPMAVLIELQRAETAVRGIAAKKAGIPAKLSMLESERRKNEDRVEEARQKIANLAKKSKERESALLKAGDELRKTKSKQFEVKTNREFEAVLKEQEALEVRIGALEEEVIIAIEAMEAAKTELEAGEQEYQNYLREHVEAQNRMETQGKRYDEQATELGRVQQALRESLPPDILKKYEALKGLYAGFAVAPVIKSVCQGCFVNIPPQTNNELMRGANIITCPRCNRIVFYQKAENGQSNS